MEIIQEYENWRPVRDAEGTEGWVNQALLSGERGLRWPPRGCSGKGKDHLRQHAPRPAGDGRPSSPSWSRASMLQIKECNGDWCRAEADGAEGWIAQAEIWGAYPGEAFK